MILPLLCVAILVGMAAEAAVLITIRKRSGRGPRQIGPNLLAGAGLVLALLAALLSAPPPLIYAGLTVGLVGHVADLKARWRD